MRKKRNLVMIGVAAFLAAIAFNINQSQDNVALSDLALENIEALAQNESGGGKPCTVIEYYSTGIKVVYIVLHGAQKVIYNYYS